MIRSQNGGHTKCVIHTEKYITERNLGSESKIIWFAFFLGTFFAAFVKFLTTDLKFSQLPENDNFNSLKNS